MKQQGLIPQQYAKINALKHHDELKGLTPETEQEAWMAAVARPAAMVVAVLLAPLQVTGAGIPVAHLYLHYCLPQMRCHISCVRRTAEFLDPKAFNLWQIHPHLH